MGGFWNCFGQDYLKFNLNKGHFYKQNWNILEYCLESNFNGSYFYEKIEWRLLSVHASTSKPQGLGFSNGYITLEC